LKKKFDAEKHLEQAVFLHPDRGPMKKSDVPGLGKVAFFSGGTAADTSNTCANS
jgi:hypothetical protein